VNYSPLPSQQVANDLRQYFRLDLKKAMRANLAN
jgi:hypothetical protein